jgi:hypothetical protein
MSAMIVDQINHLPLGVTNETKFVLRDIRWKRSPPIPGEVGIRSLSRDRNASEEQAMQQIAERLARACPVRLPVEPRHPVLRQRHAPVVPRPEITRQPRLIEAIVWLYRLLFVVPVGRRAREDRLGALSDRTLRDIGIRRADVHAAIWGRVAVRALMPHYPIDRPLVICGRPGYPLTLVRMSEAA